MRFKYYGNEIYKLEYGYIFTENKIFNFILKFTSNRQTYIWNELDYTTHLIDDLKYSENNKLFKLFKRKIWYLDK